MICAVPVQMSDVTKDGLVQTLDLYKLRIETNVGFVNTSDGYI